MAVGEQLFEFSSVNNWLQTVRDKYSERQVSSDHVICVSANGCICTTVQELFIAQFPIKVYRKPIGA